MNNKNPGRNLALLVAVFAVVAVSVVGLAQPARAVSPSELAESYGFASGSMVSAASGYSFAEWEAALPGNGNAINSAETGPYFRTWGVDYPLQVVFPGGNLAGADGQAFDEETMEVEIRARVYRYVDAAAFNVAIGYLCVTGYTGDPMPPTLAPTLAPSDVVHAELFNGSFSFGPGTGGGGTAFTTVEVPDCEAIDPDSYLVAAIIAREVGEGWTIMSSIDEVDPVWWTRDNPFDCNGDPCTEEDVSVLDFCETFEECVTQCDLNPFTSPIDETLSCLLFPDFTVPEFLAALWDMLIAENQTIQSVSAVYDSFSAMAGSLSLAQNACGTLFEPVLPVGEIALSTCDLPSSFLTTAHVATSTLVGLSGIVAAVNIITLGLGLGAIVGARNAD